MGTGCAGVLDKMEKAADMQSYQEILSRLYDLLQPMVPEGQGFEEDTDLVADLGLDSMKVMDLLASVEDHFDISVPLNILPEVHTIGDFATQLQKLIKEEA